MPDLIPGSGFDELLNQVAVPGSNLISSEGFAATPNPQSYFEAEFRKSMQTQQNLNTPDFVSPFQIDPSSRFPLQVTNMDNEDIYAQGQSSWNKAWNATLKGGALALTTFTQSTLGLVNGVFQSISDGKFSSLYDNDFNRGLDDINKELENQLPNYYSASERNNPWYTNIFTANFIFDKIVKNLGFMAGAAASGNVYARLLQVGKMAATGNMLKALQATERAVVEGKTLDTLGDTASGFSSFLKGYNALNTGQKVLVSGLATVGEAGIEALQASDQARTKLLEEFRIENGRDASGDELKRINDTASNIGNTTFALNTALLTASNYIQFPKLLGSSQRAARGMYSDLIKRADNVAFDAKTLSYVERTGSKFGKLFKRVQPFGPSITEGLEEASQYAAQTGSENFWYKKYQNGDEMNLGFLEGVKAAAGDQAFDDLLGYGAHEAFLTDEGQEQFFIGAVSGAIGKARGTAREQRQQRAATQSFIDLSNRNNLSRYTRDTLDSLNRAQPISTTMDDALRQGDVLEYKDAERDFMINYLYPKIKHGRMDLLQDEIDSYKQLAATPEGFKQLQDQGKALPTDTRESYLLRLANLERVAHSTDLAYKTLNQRNAFYTKKDADGKIVPLYSDAVTDKMVYANSKIMDYDERIPLLSTNLLTAGIDVEDLVNDTSKFDEYSTLIDNITSLNGQSVTSDKREALKTDLKDIVELTLRRKQFIDEYNDMMANPGNYEDVPQEPTKAETISITTKDGEEDIEIGTEYYLGKVVGETEQGFLSEKYPILTVLAKNPDGSLKIRDGNGNITTISADELKGYKLGKVSDVRNNPKANFFMKNRNRIFTYKFKDGKREGVLRWSPKGDELFFEYQKNGKIHRIPVNNADFSYKAAKAIGFKEPIIVATNATLTDISDADELGDKEDKLNAKLAKRLGLVTGLVTTSRNRLASLDKFITDKKSELKKVEDALESLSKTKAGVPRKKFTRALTKTLQELGETKGRLVNEINLLTDEKEELEVILPYYEDLLANVRELPEDTLELVKELKDEVGALEEIIENTTDAIKTAGEFVNNIDEALQKAYSLLNDYIKRLREENPNIPLSVEEYQTKLEKYLGEVGAQEFINNNEGYTPLLKSILSDIDEFSEELEITPNEAKINSLQAQIKELREGLDDVIKEQIAKGKILEFFEEKIKEERARKAEEAAIMKNKALQDKIFTSQKQLEVLAGDLNGGISEEENKKQLAEQQKNDSSKKKSAQVLFSSTSSRSESKIPDAQASPSVIRERNFFFNQTHFAPHIKQNLKGLTVTINNEDSLGLTGLTYSIARQNTSEGWNTLSDEDLKKVVTDPDNGVILLVYAVERDGEFFLIDENGKDIGGATEGEAILDLNQVVASTLTSTATNWRTDNISRVRDQDKDIAPEIASQWRARREQLLSHTTPDVFDVSFSRGIPIYNEVDGNITTTKLEGSLFPASQAPVIKNFQGAIKVITTDNYTHQDITYKTIPGRVYFEYEDIFAPLSNRQFNKEEQETLYQAILGLAKQATEREAAGDTHTLKSDLFTYLQHMLYWGRPSTAKDAGRNQIWIDEDFYLNFGNSGAEIPFTPISIEQNEALIKAYLSGTYNNVNNHTLANNFHDVFIEYYVDKGELKTREHANYQSFLFDNQMLETPIAPMQSVPSNGNRNFMQKYAIIQGVDYTITKKEEPKDSKVDYLLGKIGKDGKINVYRGVQGDGEKGTGQFWTTDKSVAEFYRDRYGKPNGKIVERKITIEQARKGFMGLEGNEGKAKGSDIFSLDAPPISPTPQPTGGTKLVGKTKAGENFDFTATLENGEVNVTLDPNDPAIQAIVARVTKTGMAEDKVIELLQSNALTIAAQHFAAPEEAPQEETKIVVSAKPSINLKADIEARRQAELNSIPEVKNGAAWKIAQGHINAKYDAEVAAIENKPIELSAPIDDNDEYRAMNSLSVDRMSDEEKADFNKFLKQNLPQFDLREIEHFIQMAPNRNAWGSLQGKLITLYNNAEKGTGYHEAFEGVWKYFVLPEEQEELLAEFKNRPGQFNDRLTNTNISYAEANDKQAKEELADEFARFKNGQKLSLGDKIRKFFNRIINFFRSFNRGYKINTELRDKLFDKIETGGFANRRLPSVLSNIPEYSAIRGLSEAQVHGFVQDITKRVFIQLIREGVDLFEPEIYEQKGIKETIHGKYESSIRTFPNGEQTFNELWDRTKDYLRTFNIEFDENNYVTINDENQTRNDYVNDKMTLDVKKSSPFAIKYILASLAKVKEITNEGKVIYNKEGLVKHAYQLLPFARTFITLLETFEGSTSIDHMISKLKNLIKTNPDFVPLLNMLGLKGPITNWNNLTKAQWRMLAGFYNTFNKQKPDASFLNYSDTGEVYFSTAEIGRASEAVKKQWESNVRYSAKQGKNLFVGYDARTKSYAINESELKKIQKNIGNIDTKIQFLNGIGIDFSKESHRKLDKSQRESFNNAVDTLVQYLSKNKGLKVVTGKSLGISGPLSRLAELSARVNFSQSESTFLNGEGEQQQTYVQPNYFSQLADNFNLAYSINDLYKRLPYLKNDPFAQGSELLRVGGKFFDANGNRTGTKLVLGYTDAIKEGQKGRKIADLDYPQRITTQLNNTLNGVYYIGVPADSSTEWSLDMGEFIGFTTALDNGRFETTTENLMFKYLQAEIELAKDFQNHRNLSNVGAKAQELRFFKDILSSDNLRKVNKAISNNQTVELTESIKADINRYIKSEINSLRESLEYNQELTPNGEKTFQYPTLLDTFAQDKKINKNNLSENEANSLLRYVVGNNIVANMEMHKVFFGDPYNFAIKDKGSKVILDETKRIKSFLSPAISTLVSDNYNNTFNKEFNTIGNTTLTRGIPGFYSVRNTVNTVTFSDVITQSQYVEEFNKNNEADAQALHSLQMHRDLLNRHGQWSKKAENWYKWEMAYARQELFKKGKFTNYPEALRVNDAGRLKNPKPDYTLHVIKPIVRGVKNNSTYLDPILDKFSSAPLFYSAIEGTNLENLFVKMMNENIDYVIFESGRKVGSEGKNSFYKEDGSFNNSPYTGKLTVNWKDYSVQVENSYDKGKSQTRGSQITKLFSLDFFTGGVPIDFAGKNWSSLTEEQKEAQSPIYKEVKWNNKLLEEMTKNGYENLIRKLGLTDNGTNFVITDYKKLYNTLEKEALKRDMPENIKKVFRINPETNLPFLPLESTSEYVRIQKMLYSMVDSSFLSPKVNGGPKTQLSVFGWESSAAGRSMVYKKDGKYVKIDQAGFNNLSKEEKKTVRLTSDTLKFYTKEDPYIEVLIPHWMKDKFKKAGFTTDAELLEYLNSSEEGQEILRGVGFRIPTSNMTAIEAIRVKGFLPQEYGDTIVVPTEITTKAGSDFDIDKLNTYLKNIFLDSKNRIRVVPFFGFGEEGRRKLNEIATKAAVAREQGNENALKDFEFTDDNEYLSDVELLYKQSLENEYFRSLERMITHPLNYDKLTQATDNDTLSTLAGNIAELTGTSESTKLTRLLSIDYLSKLRHAFLAGKKWVGIGAVNNTGHSQAQRANQYLDVRSTKLNQRDAEILGDGSIILPHNKDSQGRSTLSGSLDQAKNFISAKLGWYLTAFVDIAKDPYILNIIPSRKLVGTFLFLERMGVNTTTLGYFMNQPIIREYIHYTDVQGVNRVASTYYRDKFLQESTDFLGESAERVNVSNDKLKSNISDYYINKKTSQDWRNQQRRFLDEFIKYTKMAEHLFMATQATNWDTARFATGASVRKKELLLKKQREQNIIKSPDDILNISNNGKIMDAVMLSKEAIDSLSSLTSPDIRNELNTILDRYINLSYMPEKTLEKIDSQILNSFVDYLVQTKRSLNGATIQYLVSDATTSIVGRVQSLQGSLQDNPIFQNLRTQVSNRVGDADNIRISPFPKEVYEKNLFTGYLNELRELDLDVDGKIKPKSLYGDLVKLAILQGAGSQFNLLSYIPIEDTSAILTSVVGSVTPSDARDFANNFTFEKNNWRNTDIVLPFQPAYPKYKFPTKFKSRVLRVSDLFDNKNGITERPVITLERFHKIPKSPNRFDLTTGSNVNLSEVKSMISKFDYSFMDKVGYQKVYLPSGEPLTTQDVTKEGQIHNLYYYKQVNLLGSNGIQEHYTGDQQSVLNNGTVKVDTLSDQEIINEVLKINKPQAPGPSVNFEEFKKDLETKNCKK